MASGISQDYPQLLQDMVPWLCNRHSLSRKQAMSVIYALLEAELLTPIRRSIHFLETEVQLAAPLSELDTFVQQVICLTRTETRQYTTPASETDIGRGRIVATLPLGLQFPEGAASLRATFSAIIRSAHTVLRVASPYIEQPGLNNLMDAFHEAASRDVFLQLLVRLRDLNEPELGQIVAILSLYDLFGSQMEARSFHQTMGSGHYVRSLSGVHAKILVADSARAYVGSGEVRDLALNRNFEVGVEFDDETSTRTVMELFDRVWHIADPLPVDYCRRFIR